MKKPLANPADSISSSDKEKENQQEKIKQLQSKITLLEQQKTTY